MLVPWARRAAIFNELMAQADAMVKAGNLVGAIPLYQQIIDMRDRRFTPIVRAKLDAINADQLRETTTAISMTTTVATRIELPGWVKENTTGVIVTPGDAVCLVGDFVLRRGEPIPAYPEVKVATITPTTVTYVVQDEKFEVVLKHDEVAGAGK
jgi:hypothetical protein